MHLAKPHLDIGLFTKQIERQKAFWGDTVGLRFDHELKLRKGWVQHRYDAHGSVIKVNHVEDDLSSLAPTGYVAVTIARQSAVDWEGSDADGNRVRLVAPGTRGVSRVGVTVQTPDPDRMMQFYCEAMQFERVEQHTAQCGDSLLFVEEGVGGAEMEDLIGPGYRYLTVQIFDADRCCEEIVSRGGRLARSPISHGQVARYGFVKDPDGNWIEISARTSLTGIAPATQ